MGKANKIKSDLDDITELVEIIQVLKDVADTKFHDLANRKDRFARFGESFVEYFRMISLSEVRHPLVSNDVKKVGIVSITSEAGFMGDLNAKVIRATLQEQENHPESTLIAVGKKGAEIDILKNDLRHLTGKEVWVEVEEIKRPDLDAKLVADGIAKQLERRIPFRRILKKAMQTSMDAGAAGIKVQVSGRIGGAEIARVEWYKEGRIPLHTLRADIDYAQGRAETTYGSIGVKVWINKGEDIIAAPKPQQAIGA